MRAYPIESRIISHAAGGSPLSGRGGYISCVGRLFRRAGLPEPRMASSFGPFPLAQTATAPYDPVDRLDLFGVYGSAVSLCSDRGWPRLALASPGQGAVGAPQSGRFGKPGRLCSGLFDRPRIFGIPVADLRPNSGLLGPVFAELFRFGPPSPATLADLSVDVVDGLDTLPPDFHRGPSLLVFLLR